MSSDGGVAVKDLGKSVTVVVEMLATEREARGTYTLILRDAGRQRTSPSAT